MYEGVSKSFRTGRLELELQMIQLSATSCSCIYILWVSLVSFAAITLCVASERVFIFVSVYFAMTQSGNFWIHPRILDLDVRWRWVVSFTSRLLYPGARFLVGWVGPRAGLDTLAMKNIPSPAGNRTPFVQTIVSHYTDWATPAAFIVIDYVILWCLFYFL
jgi:hypothetical protein